jgi:hypothetical protein
MTFLKRIAQRAKAIRIRADLGMTTAEYAVGTIAPVGRLIRSQRPEFAGLHWVLLRVVTATMAA